MIIHVPADYPTIYAAMNAASPGDEVEIAPGTYLEQNLKFHGKAITVRSESPNDESVVDTTIVRGDGNSPTFNLYADETANSIIRGLTITSDEADEPYLFGGGIDLFESSPTIENCQITGNRAIYGGGICCYLSSARIRHNRITHNNANLGGGIHTASSSVEIEHNMISDNLATLYGGGVHAYNVDAGVMLRHNVIHHNASNLGPGLNIGGSAPSQVSNNLICHNLEYLHECGTPVGGGIRSDNYAGQILNNTISHNAAELGGNLYVRGEIIPEVRNNIISFATRGSGVFSYQVCVQLAFCDVYGNENGDFENMDSQVGINGNISQDPLFHDADSNDFHLQSRSGRWHPSSNSWVTDIATSPCIDAGDPDSDFSNEPTGNGSRINLGAYGNTAEASKSPLTLGTIFEVVIQYILRFLQEIQRLLKTILLR